MCFWGCDIVASNGAGYVKSGYCGKKWCCSLSVRYGSSANKVRCQTSKLNARLGVEIYFIFGIISEDKIRIQNELGLHHTCIWQQNIHC
jgi:hypothetical protein